MKTGANLVLSDLFDTISNPNAQQKSALANLLKHGTPTLRTERWRYTTLRKAIHNQLALVANTTGELPIHPALKNIKNAEQVTILNGALHGDFGSTGVELTTSHTAIEFDSYKHDDNFIDNSNLAFAPHTLKLNITKATNKLLVLHFHHSIANTLHANRVEINAAKNSSANILILHSSDDDLNSTLIPVITLKAGENSQITIINLQDLGNSTFQLAKMHTQLAANSVFKFTQLDIGGQLTRHDVVVDVLGKGAEFIHNNLIHGVAKQLHDTHLDVYHHVAHTQSTMTVKAVLDEKSRGVFNGKIYVEVDAQKVDANLQNNNLLLSQYAEIDTKPELEIYADDVKCAHGATVGQLNEESLFYLRSRGIDKEAAEKVLVSAFSRSTYQGLVPAEIETYLDDRLGFES